MTLKIKVYAAVDIAQVGDPTAGASTFNLPANLSPLSVLKSSAAQVSQVYAGVLTLNASATQTLDLYGSLIDALGDTLDFANIKGVFLQADPGNTGNLIVGDAATHAFLGNNSQATNTETLGPGAFKFDFDPTGWAVANGTNDQLLITNGDGVNPANLTVIIFG